MGSVVMRKKRWSGVCSYKETDGVESVVTRKHGVGSVVTRKQNM